MKMRRRAGARLLTSIIAGLIATGLHELRVRRDLRRLRMMDAHLLKDLGLNSGGLEHAVRHGRTVGKPRQ